MDLPVTPEQRALFESAGRALYDEAIAASSLDANDPRFAEDGEAHDTAMLLLDLGLLIRDGDLLLPEDPSHVQGRIVTPMSRTGGQLLAESSAWAEIFTEIGKVFRGSPVGETRGPITYLPFAEVNDYMVSLTDSVEEEVLTAQPQAGRDPAAMADAVLRDAAMLERGASMRTLYQHSARRSKVTRRYVDQISERGAEVRTLDEFFNRMIVVDRRVAVIPSAQGLQTAVAIREPAIVSYFVDVFERSWDRGRPFGAKHEAHGRAIASEQREMTIRMLVEGHADNASAKRLGVSPRTYAGYVSDLKQEYHADSRFQLGYILGRRGIGPDTTDED